MPLRTFIFITLLLSYLTACSTQAPAPVVSGPSSGTTPAGMYQVKAGDTLYQIARRHHTTVNNLVRWNQLSNQHDIKVGQLLRIHPPAMATTQKAVTQPTPPAKHPTQSTEPVAKVGHFKLIWPVKGKIVGRFDGQNNKGINIAGAAGTPIQAAADGKVVYVGTGIRAYGHLIIVKHNAEYLTAYAYNEKLLAKEGQLVKAGDAIATMGNSGSMDEVMLHFELRHIGKAVNPQPYLP